MAKKSRRLVLSFLLLPLLCVALLRTNVSPLHLWKLRISHWPSSTLSNTSNEKGIEGKEYTRFLLRRLLRGKARRELSRNGVSCISDPESDICITSDTVRISTGPSSSSTVYLTAGQRLPNDSRVVVRPYPRKTDPLAMRRTSAVNLVTGVNDAPACDITHSVPAVIFSIGGFAGNFFHDINDVIIPLFLTSSHLRYRVHLVITDYVPWWAAKYHHVLAHVSKFQPIVATSLSPMEPKVHCFPAAIVGLKYHGNLICNSTEPPGGISILDFTRFLQDSLSLKAKQVAITKDPILVLLSRKKSRMLLNEDGVVELAKEMGFHVVLVKPEQMRKLEEFAELVNACSILMGVHGAGLTNMVFQPPGAVLLQVVPWGLDWASKAYYGRPAHQMGLHYVEYHTAVEESTLYDEYPRDHPVLADPWSINLKGYNVSKPLYTDGQNIRLDLPRFKETLLHALQLLPRPSLR